MARQKTGRQVGRPSLYSEGEEPVTVSLRIPHDLAAQMKRYAKMHSQSVTALLLDGLTWRLEEGDPRGLGIAIPRTREEETQEHYSNTAIGEQLGETLQAIRTVVERQEAHLATLTQALVAMGHYGNTAHEHATTPTQAPALSGQTTTILPVGVTAPAKPMPEISDYDNTVLPEKNEQTAIPPYDTSKYMLGELCVHGHDYDSSGQSLRQRMGKHECVECMRTRKRAYKKRQRQAEAPGTTSLGH
jgi:hypothetical protein